MGHYKHLGTFGSLHLLLTISLLFQLLVVSMYPGQLVLMEHCHFPHLLQSLTVTKSTLICLRTMFINEESHAHYWLLYLIRPRTE